MTHDKTLPPTLVLVFVRSEEIDAVAQVIRQPKVKLRELLTELVKCSFRKKFTKRELFSLIGILSFAARQEGDSRPQLLPRARKHPLTS